MKRLWWGHVIDLDYFMQPLWWGHVIEKDLPALKSLEHITTCVVVKPHSLLSTNSFLLNFRPCSSSYCHTWKDTWLRSHYLRFGIISVRFSFLRKKPHVLLQICTLTGSFVLDIITFLGSATYAASCFWRCELLASRSSDAHKCRIVTSMSSVFRCKLSSSADPSSSLILAEWLPSDHVLKDWLPERIGETKCRGSSCSKKFCRISASSSTIFSSLAPICVVCNHLSDYILSRSFSHPSTRLDAMFDNVFLASSCHMTCCTLIRCAWSRSCLHLEACILRTPDNERTRSRDQAALQKNPAQISL